MKSDQLRILRSTTTHTEQARRVAKDRRRGMSLVVVMFAISMSLVLTYSFMRTRTTALQINQNVSRGDLALEAAQAGAAMALRQIQSADWSGVEETLSRQVASSSAGTTYYRVQFQRLPEKSDRPNAVESALTLVIHSVGVWEPADDRVPGVERAVEVTVRLRPRLPGRQILEGDSASIQDVAVNPGDYDAIQKYAVFAGKKRHSLVLNPGDRIDGNVWLYDEMRVYRGPNWPDEIRQQILSDLGESSDMRSGSSIAFSPFHPLVGEVMFFQEPSKSMVEDLGLLQTPWKQASQILKWPRVRFPSWVRYRVYDGGFEYSAAPLRWKLENVTLRPTADNPLGVFYRQGNLEIRDHVTVQGTLIVNGAVTFTGDSIYVGSFNWRGRGGEPLVSHRENWPRLPAIVAKSVYFRRETRSIVEGAMIVEKSVKGGGAHLEFQTDPRTTPELDGWATSHPLRQPFSVVQIEDLAGGTLEQLIDASTRRHQMVVHNADPADQDVDYAIWLDDGRTGDWYPIVRIDSERHQLTVVGEVTRDTPMPFRLRPNRKFYIDVRGPISGRQHIFARQEGWDWDEADWFEMEEEWNTETSMAGQALEDEAEAEEADEQSADEQSADEDYANEDYANEGYANADFSNEDFANDESAGKDGYEEGSAGEDETMTESARGANSRGQNAATPGPNNNDAGNDTTSPEPSAKDPFASELPRSFVDYLADPDNFQNWGYPYDVSGLTMEPTFHLRSTPEISYRWELPLFRAFVKTREKPDQSGYRWEVISWRVVK